MTREVACPICHVRYPWTLTRHPGALCLSVSANQVRPCVGRLIAGTHYDRAEWRERTQRKTAAHRVNITGCARCGGNHQGADAYAFDRAPEVATHYATCTKTGQPILITLETQRI